MINPVGSQIYINQNMHVAAAKIGSRSGSAEYSQLANQMTSQEKVQEIQEISPGEKNAKINPDREHQKHHNQDEQEAEEKSKQHKEQQDNKTISSHTDTLPKEATRYKKLDFLA